MAILNQIRNKVFFSFLIVSIILLGACGIYQKSDARKIPPGSKEKVKKNLEEGKGISIEKLRGGIQGGTNFQFASSNVMWRATLEILDFLPLSNVDYSGGIITTEWYNEGTAINESIKITVRFLSNEIRADGIKIIVHKKSCSIQNECTVRKIDSALENELRVAILKKAIIYQKDFNKGKKKFKRSDTK
tara:strand:- start:612 stop:1178 length:567 start_codon:yes stop_codon:yes gene_type:complete